VIAALAIDQRGAMRELFSKPMGKDPAISRRKSHRIQEAVSRILTPMQRDFARP